MNDFFLGLGLIIFAYLMGSLPFGLWIGKLWANVDVREYGSGNIGVSNVLRTVGVVPAIITLIFDVGKGLVPVLIAKNLLENEIIWIIIGLAAILGHTLPIFLRFKGGRGVATAGGVLLALSWQLVVILFTVWVTTLAIFRYISLASVMAAIALPICLIILRVSTSFFITGLFLAILVIWRHTPNIKRLLAGNEYRIGEKARKN